MIRPQNNAWRAAIDLSGLWRARADEPGAAEHAIAVPGSWNEQLAEAGFMNRTGPVWLSTRVRVPETAAGRRVVLRFGSADYRAEVFWNGARVGASGPLMLPFEVDVTAGARPGETAGLAVRVTAELPDDGPMQRVRPEDYVSEGRPKDEYTPAVRFDFFPFGGLNRAVHLCLLPRAALTAWRIDTAIDGADGVATLRVEADGLHAVRATLADATAEAAFADGRATLTLRLPGCRLWSPEDPALHALALEGLDAGGAVADRIDADVGIRTVRVEGGRLLLNGRPVELRGFGKHEDSAVHGRGVNLPMLVKDFGLLRWCGANSVRTGHYPYDESFYDLADREGVLVIDELFSVNLDFRRVTAAGLEAHKAAAAALIARDANHPCVIAWSLANEPGYLGEACYAEASRPYWRELFAHARALDPTRPLTHANVQYAGLDDPAFEVADLLMINRYHGWYSVPGQLDEAADRLRADLDRLAAHGKPLFVSEFGADAVAGLHATHDQLWTEEYQADLIARYWAVIRDHPACIGGHVWNFADFRTAQHARRAVLNLKGVFTRAREPKRAAWRLRELWR